MTHVEIGKTVISEDGLSLRGFRSKSAASRYTTSLIIEQQRCDSASISLRWPDCYVVCWREKSRDQTLPKIGACDLCGEETAWPGSGVKCDFCGDGVYQEKPAGGSN
jgi:hypothetical protein